MLRVCYTPDDYPAGKPVCHLDGVGGDFSIHGAIKLRSMFQILSFLAKGINAVKEFGFAPDSRTGKIEASPTETLKINVTDNAPG